MTNKPSIVFIESLFSKRQSNFDTATGSYQIV